MEAFENVLNNHIFELKLREVRLSFEKPISLNNLLRR